MLTYLRQSPDWIVNNPKYKHLFQGIGRFKCDLVQIKLTQNATPVQKPPRRVPLALKDQFKQELDNMVSQGILSKLDDVNVNAPEWLNSFVVVKKPNGKLRICLDPTDLNPFIVRPVCNARTMDEIALLKDAVHFAVFDSTKGFFHVPLDEASKMLTAMLTPAGIYIYNALADLGGVLGACPPMGPNYFIFAFIFAKKHPCQSSTPPQWVHTPLWETLDPPLQCVGNGIVQCH